MRSNIVRKRGRLLATVPLLAAVSVATFLGLPTAYAQDGGNVFVPGNLAVSRSRTDGSVCHGCVGRGPGGRHRGGISRGTPRDGPAPPCWM